MKLTIADVLRKVLNYYGPSSLAYDLDYWRQHLEDRDRRRLNQALRDLLGCPIVEASDPDLRAAMELLLEEDEL